MSKTYPFVLPKLQYEYDALEPYIDKETMHFHHDKHHLAYLNNLNNALKDHPELHNKTLEELLKNLNALPEAIKGAVRNNGGGFFNHNLFFDIMTPFSTKKPKGKLAEKIDKKFGSFEAFKAEFKKAAMTRFGSGWAWLVLDKDNELQVLSTPNQDVPMNLEVLPLVGLDVWEHAYYLKYQNLRGDYVDNFFEVIDWEKIEKTF